MPRLWLQQYLPFTVLKLKRKAFLTSALPTGSALQQYLPFTVLKLFLFVLRPNNNSKVATVLTVYGIETRKESH